jgi:hypothetical protein
MQDLSAFQFLAIDQIHESPPTPAAPSMKPSCTSWPILFPGTKSEFCGANRFVADEEGAAWKQAVPLRDRHITITASQAISTALDRHAIPSLGEVIPKFRLEGGKPPQQPASSSG